MTKRDQLLATVQIREPRPSSEIRAALSPEMSRKRERRWVQKIFSFRKEDLARIDSILSELRHQGQNATQSQIVRSGLLALQERSDRSKLIQRLNQAS
jgi:hypothetical protein